MPADGDTSNSAAARTRGHGAPVPARGSKLSDWGLEVIEIPGLGYCGYQSIAKLLHCEIEAVTDDATGFFSILAKWGCAGGDPD